MFNKKIVIYLIIIMFSFLKTSMSENSKTFYDFKINSINGEELNLSIFKDKDFSLLVKIEHAISPYVAFMIMPLFAFANAGVNLEGLSLSSLLSPVPLGILCGLFFGKQIGVLLFSYVSIKLKFAEAPNNSNWLSLYGVSILTGIGFTMSLFVGNLAFVENAQYMDGVKIGVLTGSLLSTVFGYVILLMSSRK